MYRNLEAELVRAGITKREMAKRIGCTPATLSLKLNGKAPLYFSEAVRIKEALKIDMPLDKLFEPTRN